MQGFLAAGRQTFRLLRVIPRVFLSDLPREQAAWGVAGRLGAVHFSRLLQERAADVRRRVVARSRRLFDLLIDEPAGSPSRRKAQ